MTNTAETVLHLGSSINLHSARGNKHQISQQSESVGLTVDQMTQHTVVFGSTGTGKTFSVLNPLVRQWLDAHSNNNERAGLMLIDGKNTLCDDFADLKDLIIITPANHTQAPLSLTEGLDACSFTTALKSGVKDSGDDFETVAEQVVLNASRVLTLLDACEPNSGHWTVDNLSQFVSSLNDLGDDSKKPYYTTVIEQAKANIDDNTGSGFAINDAVGFFEKKMSQAAADEIAGAVNSVVLHLSHLYLSPELARWTAADTGIDPTSCLRGELIGIQLPVACTGAGSIIASLVKARVLNAALDRHDRKYWVEDEHAKDEAPLLIVCDESQELMSDIDVQCSGVIRSKGVSLLYAMQSVNSLSSALAQAQTNAFLMNMNNVISVHSDRDTAEYLSEKSGSTPYQSAPKQGRIGLST